MNGQDDARGHCYCHVGRSKVSQGHCRGSRVLVVNSGVCGLCSLCSTTSIAIIGLTLSTNALVALSRSVVSSLTNPNFARSNGRCSGGLRNSRCTRKITSTTVCGLIYDGGPSCISARSGVRLASLIEANCGHAVFSDSARGG